VRVRVPGIGLGFHEIGLGFQELGLGFEEGVQVQVQFTCLLSRAQI
jgi:hypothetical protein